MNIVRCIFPLGLRQAVFYRLLGSRCSWPGARSAAGFPLALAPVAVQALISTDISHRSIAWTGVYDLGLSRRIAELGKRGGVFVDVGANVGYFSLLWASLRDTNRVLAFEPSPTIAKMLETNVTQAGLASRIKVYAVALGRSRGPMRFVPGPKEQTGWGGLTICEDPASFPAFVETLDEAAHDLERIAVLKIDTEGADAWVLEGARALLEQRRIDHVFCEINAERMRALGIAEDQPRRILESHGYHVEQVGRSGTELHAWVPRSPHQ